MQLFAPTLFGWFIHNPDILKACNEYLFARSFGVFFSYMGVVAVALYTGIARTNVIIYNSIILGIANALLNYGLIFGNWGFPKMGMAGAAWASTFSEVLAFALFTIYLLRDKFVAQNCRFIARPKIDFALIKAQISLSLPIVFQSIVGIGSWQVFFFMVEGMDEQGQALAVSNLLRTVYMVLMIPSWGFASGMNTIASNLIGQERHTWVLPAIFKTAVLCLGVTMFLSFATVVAFPDFILTQFVQDPNIVNATKELVWVLVGILATVAVGSVYFNGMVGTGATRQSLWIQIACCVFYQAYTIASIKFLNASLPVAWLSELFYWVITLGLSYWYLASGKWKNIQV
jgi:Na+-driven multidrug efflux pump